MKTASYLCSRNKRNSLFMKKYKHLFFDIDRTLWDYKTNVREVLQDIYNKYNLQGYSIGFENFLNVFDRYNELLWTKFRKGQIKKEVLRDRRFYLTLKKLGIKDNDFALKCSSDYIELSPNKINLFPDVIETLEYLKTKYRLHVITNGFTEVQFKKLKNSGIKHFFEKVVTSDNAGSQKPNMKIFEYALTSVNAKKVESLMIGDDWDLDVMGAKSYGFDQVYFNPDNKVHDGKATFEINSINELKLVL
jgi:putative hydrolase of the HAD superfamily